MAGLEDQLTITITIGNGNGPGGNDPGPFFADGELVTKAEAEYRASTSDTESCGACVHYSNASCDLVAGGISPEMVCDLFDPEAEADVVEIQQGQTGRRRVKKAD